MNALAMYLLFRFWRQLVFALIVCWACQFWLGGSTWVIAGSFVGGFAFIEALFLVDRRHRLRRGLPPRSRPVVVASAIFLCVVPGVAFGLGFASGRQFPSDSSNVGAVPKQPHTHREVKDQTQAAWDGDVLFAVLDIKRSTLVVTVAGSALTPVPGDRLTVVDMILATGDDPAIPFCERGFGALLVDAAGRRFKTVAGVQFVRGVADLGLKGGLVCDELAPNSAVQERLVFQMPAADRTAGIAVWDKDQIGDRLGRTYVYFRVAKSDAVPDLGAAAWGPARDS